MFIHIFIYNYVMKFIHNYIFYGNLMYYKNQKVKNLIKFFSINYNKVL